MTDADKVFPPIGMSPDVWGPIFWNTMHIATLGYADEPSADEQKAAKEFFHSLQFMSPCPICRYHYSEILKTNPVEPAVVSRTKLVQWAFHIHNLVSKEIGKSESTWEQFIESVLQLSNSKSPQHKDYMWIYALIAGMGIGVGAYAFYKTLK
jgi:hypothetical protein